MQKAETKKNGKRETTLRPDDLHDELQPELPLSPFRHIKVRERCHTSKTSPLLYLLGRQTHQHKVIFLPLPARSALHTSLNH